MIASNIQRDGSGNLLFAGRNVAELAKKYGQDSSGSFVNGVLAKFV